MKLIQLLHLYNLRSTVILNLKILNLEWEKMFFYKLKATPFVPILKLQLLSITLKFWPNKWFYK